MFSSEFIAQLERIGAAGIQLLPVAELQSYFVFERDGFAVLVERRGEGFGAIGSPGMLVAKGFAALVRREGKDYFVRKGEERAAQAGEAEAARRLFTNLKSALH